MENLYQRYRQLRRQHHTAPARVALHWARHSLALHNRIAATGFAWQRDHHYRDFAHWSESGFDLHARIVEDNDGWWSLGIEDYGKFSPSWKPGAVRHWRGGARDCEWFIPANPEYAKQDYNRACDYGHGWWYVGIEVIARRAGIELGNASLWGIESDSGEEYFTETAFELADEAIAEARNAMQRLCGSH
ncbi:MAG TPA: hypothetical protein VK971_13520 [Thiohalobacter sp.]|nr:hypothetical protein [Thiohalobacter sp.]